VSDIPVRRGTGYRERHDQPKTYIATIAGENMEILASNIDEARLFAKVEAAKREALANGKLIDVVTGDAA
jgi:hypothetical protein